MIFSIIIWKKFNCWVYKKTCADILLLFVGNESDLRYVEYALENCMHKDSH